MTSAKVGFFGGTFDPIHIAHLECAMCAYEQLDLEKVLIVPAGIPSFKRDCDFAPAEDRLAMCELACAGNDALEASGIEARRDGVTYSIDTIRELREMLPRNMRIFFIIGSDAYLTLPKWREWKALSQLVSFAVLMRPGDDESQVREATETDGIAASLVDCPKLEISSSYLRQAIREGRSIRYLTPEPVWKYIEERGLYA